MPSREFDLIVFDWEGTLANSFILPLKSSLFPGVRELLQELRQLDYLLSIATGKTRQGLNRSLEACELTSFFDATCCADETRPKPHPAMLQELIQLFDVDPKRTLMIGDSADDLQLAHNAGTAAIAINHDGHTVAHSYHPRYSATNIAQLRNWLLHHG